jgi:hypothetical protein
MAERQDETTQLLESLEITVTESPEGLQFYHVIDHNELDPNGEPVMYEITASEYIELANTLDLG